MIRVSGTVISGVKVIKFKNNKYLYTNETENAWICTYMFNNLTWLSNIVYARFDVLFFHFQKIFRLLERKEPS